MLRPICMTALECRYGNELDVRASLQLLVDHLHAGKAAQARALQVRWAPAKGHGHLPPRPPAFCMLQHQDYCCILSHPGLCGLQKQSRTVVGLVRPARPHTAPTVQGLVQPTAGTELRHMLDLCLYFIPAHRLKVHVLQLCCHNACTAWHALRLPADCLLWK